MKKRFMSLLLCLALLLALGACAAQAETASSQPVAEASVSKAEPQGQSTAQSSAGDTEPAAFERARLWDDTLPAVVTDFAATLSGPLLTGEENQLFSPIGMYLTLGMLSQGAMGDTGAQMMDVLGASSPGEAFPLREVEDFFWNVGNYSGEPAPRGPGFLAGDKAAQAESAATQFTVSNSLWLGQGHLLRQSFATSASVDWHAQVFEDIPFGTPAGDDAYGKWVQEATGGKLEAASPLGPDTALVAVSAAYLRDGWLDGFDPAATAPGVFHLSDGQEAQAEYMSRHLYNHGYFKGEGYLQTVQFLQGGAEVHFVLPDADVPLSSLLQDAGTLSAILGQQYEKYGELSLMLPKFAFESKVPAVQGLQAMGMSNAFDPAVADFSGVQQKDSQAPSLYLQDFLHQTYISVNEDGVEAAALTEAPIAATGAMEEGKSVVEFKLDRPFLVFIRNQGMPIFVGVVANPAA